MDRSTRSVGEILRARQGLAFLGRHEELQTFVDNLDDDPLDPQHKFVIAVTGQGGAGKTSLLSEYRRLAAARGYRSGYVDHRQSTVPEIMRKLAIDLDSDSFKAYMERDRRFQELLHQIDGDPDLPQGLATAIARNAGTVGVRLARHAPGVGVVAELVDEQQVGDQAAALLAALVRKFSNKDDVAVLRDPVATLTPLFLDGLRRLSGRGAVFLLDEYETRAPAFDPWLIGVLSGEQLPSTTLVVVAGRDGLDVKSWNPLVSLIQPLNIDVFSEPEARDLLAGRGVTNELVVSEILRLSGRLPVLVSMLAATAPNDEQELSDPASTAVGLFLKWTSDPTRRHLAIAAAIPRRLNRDRLAAIADVDDEAFDWLTNLPFIFRDRDGWVFHQLVRALMLRHIWTESPDRWRSMNGAAAGHIQALIDALPGEEAGSVRILREYEFEHVYHTVAADRGSVPLDALESFARAYWNVHGLVRSDREQLASLAAAVQQAEEDSGQPSDLMVGANLQAATALSEQFRFESAATSITELLAMESIGRQNAVRGRFLEIRGDLHARARNFEEGLRDLDEALVAQRPSKYVLADRARMLHSMGRHSEALVAIDKALAEPDATGLVRASLLTQKTLIVNVVDGPEAAHDIARDVLESAPSHRGAALALGVFLIDLGRHDEARDALYRLIEASPGAAHPSYKQIARSHVLEHRYEPAKEALELAIKASPACTECWVNLATIFSEERGREAVAESMMTTQVVDAEAFTPDVRFVRACALARVGFPRLAESECSSVLEAEPHHVGALRQRGLLRAFELGDAEGALTDFDQALILEPRIPHVLRARAACLRRLGRLDEALRDLDDALRIRPGWQVAIFDRGSLYYSMEENKKALTDLEAAAAHSDLRKASANERGLLHSYNGDFGTALVAYAEVERGDERLVVSYNIAVSTSCRDGHDSDSEEWRKVLPMLEGDPSVTPEEDLYVRASLAALEGRIDDALALLSRGGEGDSPAVAWARRDMAWEGLRHDPRFRKLVRLEGEGP